MSLEPNHPLATSCVSSELLHTGISESLDTVTTGTTSTICAVLSLLPSGFPLFYFLWAPFPLGKSFLQPPLPSLPVSPVSSCCLAPARVSVMCLLSIAPPGTLICCSFPHRLYTMSWGFMCMCVCDSIKQNTIKSAKTEGDTDR